MQMPIFRQPSLTILDRLTSQGRHWHYNPILLAPMPVSSPLHQTCCHWACDTVIQRLLVWVYTLRIILVLKWGWLSARTETVLFRALNLRSSETGLQSLWSLSHRSVSHWSPLALEFVPNQLPPSYTRVFQFLLRHFRCSDKPRNPT